MKRFLCLILFVQLTMPLLVKADEGMWLPALVEKLNINQMKNKGFMLSADDIYNINHSSLKDAVVSLDRGQCTAEVISADGLLLTNHHCGFENIQQHSTVEHDYLRDGFWARSKEEELPNPGKTVSFLIRVEDVSDKILPELNDQMNNEERTRKVREITQKLEKEAVGEKMYDARVQSLFAENKYYLFVYQTFRDIRLVGAPPQSIGKFGGDTDNWMWPRHTNDFSMFRVYCDKNGNPAPYSKDNVPYKPKRHLTISLKGYEPGDFAMVMGYPGTTNRYKTSFGVEYTMNATNPIRIKVREEKQRIMKEFMRSSQKARIMYASKYARSSNYYKYSIGQNQGLTRLQVIAKKKELERKFTQWMNADATRKAKYGEALNLIASAYNDTKDEVALEYMNEAMLRGADIFTFAYQSEQLEYLLKEKNKTEQINVMLKRIKEQAEYFYEDYDMATDQKIAAALFKIYQENVDPVYYPTFIKTIQEKYKGDYTKFVNEAYSKSVFASKEKLQKFLEEPKAKTIAEDGILKLAKDIYSTATRIATEARKTNDALAKGNRLFVGGLMEMEKDKNFYPDANSTMRLTYGTVGGYEPRDGVEYNYFTTLKGYIEKEIPGDEEFDVPAKLKELYYAKDFGRYADKDGTLHTCFISNNDITGGNSGSPVMNAKGELIGVAFDGNWEAMSGDIAFETQIQKCINVDIRFVLWTIDKLAGAKNLIDEMTIVE